MSPNLKFLIINSALLGANITNFFYNLVRDQIWWALIPTVAVPFSIWGIHTALRGMRLESQMVMQAFAAHLMMQHVASNAAESGADKPNQPG
jgi:hypothetical protein